MQKICREILLFIHGTGDDNVQYDNAEALLNELIKYNKTVSVYALPKSYTCTLRRRRNEKIFIYFIHRLFEKKLSSGSKIK